MRRSAVGGRRTVPRVLVVALLLLGLGWAAAPHSAPPIYDGIGNPDDPYRFVVNPAGYHNNKAPSVAKSSASVTGGKAGGIQAASIEQAPQVTIAIPADRLQAPGAKSVSVTAKAAQPLPAPDGEFLWSNVYAVTATGGAELHSGIPPATITLRAATAQKESPTIEYYGSGGWQHLKTIPATPGSQDIYQAPLEHLGKYAVFGSTKLDVAQINLGGGEDPASNKGIIIALIAVALVIVLFVIGERRRSKARRAARARRAAEADAEETDD